MDIVYLLCFDFHTYPYKNVLIHGMHEALVKKISSYHLMLRMPYTYLQTLYPRHTQEEYEVATLFPRGVLYRKKHLNENLQHH